MKREIKVGDLVRVPGSLACGTWHGYHAGQVVEVVDLDVAYPGQVQMRGVGRSHGDAVIDQGMHKRHLKLAKQAMNKREQYSERRG